MERANKLIRSVTLCAHEAEKNGLEAMTHRPQGIKLSEENCRKEEAKATSRGEAAQGLGKARLTNERPRPPPAGGGRSDGR